MNPRCQCCDYPFERESGFYLGAIYFNYGLTALIVAIGFPLVTLSQLLTPNTALAIGMAIAILFPILFFRHARSFWLTLDEWIDPYQDPTSRVPESRGH
ncbi:MAG: DUF983 domain-containing protein [Planctomycetaceae bacterium]|nr:DUF983 domain-containing protein [Planctomycetaceae bacterium]